MITSPFFNKFLSFIYQISHSFQHTLQQTPLKNNKNTQPRSVVMGGRDAKNSLESGRCAIGSRWNPYELVQQWKNERRGCSELDRHTSSNLRCYLQLQRAGNSIKLKKTEN